MLLGPGGSEDPRGAHGRPTSARGPRVPRSHEDRMEEYERVPRPEALGAFGLQAEWGSRGPQEGPEVPGIQRSRGPIHGQ